MKRNILYLSIISMLVLNSCKDYLGVKSESRLTNDFVFETLFDTDKAVLGVYENLRANAGIHGSGLFYDVIAVGSDIEVGPELPTTPGRYTIENFYALPPQLSNMPIGSWNGMYSTINRCNIILKAIASSDAFSKVDTTQPSALGHLYGELVAIRATMYFELTRSWGDVIYFTKPIESKADYENATLTDRSTIQENEINNLIRVEPMMYHLNSGGDSKTAVRMTKEFVEGMIGRMALIRGGYALRPASYTGDGDVIQSHPDWGKMVRRTDWKNYYTVANTYLKKLILEGKAVFTTTDPRTPAAKFSNPFQYIFQQMMDYKISSESIFEISETKGATNEYGYAFGRASDGGSPAYPPKVYGQIRFFPNFYYGMFHPKDLRRDVTITPTALGGVADEKIITFKKGNKSSGGLCLNKWDISRMTDKSYATIQRQSGINAPYMRLDDMILLLAETYAVLGDEANAKAQLLTIRKRAFNSTDAEYSALTTDYVNNLTGDALLSAIQDERAFEMAGEGQRKYDLVRWGLLGKKINQLQTEMGAIINAIKTTKSYTFANGNVLNDSVYVQEYTQAQSGLSNLLTTTCDVPKTDPLYPILYPGWRGTAIDWIPSAGVTLKKVSLSIRGLFETVDKPTMWDLVTRKIVQKKGWGIDLVADANGWSTTAAGNFGGYLPASYNANYPPRYILAIPATTIIYSNGNISNSYGFPNQ